MLSDVFRSVPSLQEHGRLLSNDEVENGLRTILPTSRGQGSCGYHRVAEFDATASDREEVIRWFQSLDTPASTVNVYWIEQREGIRLPLNLFVSYFDDLWFPSSHDVVVEDQESRYLFFLDHEEQFSFWQRNCTL